MWVTRTQLRYNRVLLQEHMCSVLILLPPTPGSSTPSPFPSTPSSRLPLPFLFSFSSRASFAAPLLDLVSSCTVPLEGS